MFHLLFWDISSLTLSRRNRERSTECTFLFSICSKVSRIWLGRLSMVVTELSVRLVPVKCQTRTCFSQRWSWCPSCTWRWARILFKIEKYHNFAETWLILWTHLDHCIVKSALDNRRSHSHLPWQFHLTSKWANSDSAIGTKYRRTVPH